VIESRESLKRVLVARCLPHVVRVNYVHYVCLVKRRGERSRSLVLNLSSHRLGLVTEHRSFDRHELLVLRPGDALQVPDNINAKTLLILGEPLEVEGAYLGELLSHVACSRTQTNEVRRTILGHDIGVVDAVNVWDSHINPANFVGTTRIVCLNDLVVVHDIGIVSG